jgi:hypothetical protein
MEGTETVDTSTDVVEDLDGGSEVDADNQLSPETLAELTKTTQEEIQEEPEPKLYKIKVKGEEKEISEEELRKTFEISPETAITDDVANALLKSKNLEIAARQAFSEATNARKQVEAFVEMFASDPMSILTDPKMPWDFEDLVVDFVTEKIRLEKMSPSERKAMELEIENKRFKEQIERENQEKSKVQYEREVEYHQNNDAQDIVKTMESAGLPETQVVFQRFAYHMGRLINQAKQEGYNYNPTAADVLPIVQAEIDETLAYLGKKADPQKLEKTLGADAMKKLRDHEISKVKKNAAPRREAIPGATPKQSEQANKKMSIQQFREMMDAKMGSM